MTKKTGKNQERAVNEVSVENEESEKIVSREVSLKVLR